MKDEYTNGWTGGPVSRGSFEPFGGNRYNTYSKRETTYTAIEPYNIEELTGAYARANQFKGDN